MLNSERLSNYLLPASGVLSGVTPRQARRLRHKKFSRKTHDHPAGATCPRCKPGWVPAPERRLWAQDIYDELTRTCPA